MHQRWRAWVEFLVLAALLGCGPEAVWVTRRPAFDYEKIRSIGVIRFVNSAKSEEGEAASTALADKIARFLIEHRDYQVVTPEQVSKALEARKLSPTWPLDDESVKRIGEAVGVEALVTGVVTAANFKQTQTTRYQPEYTDTGYALYREGAYPYQSTRNEAEIVAEMRLYDARTGKILWTDTYGYKSWAQGAPPPWDRERVLEDAADQVAAKLFLGLVVHKDRPKIPSESIFTSKGFAGQQFIHRTNEFSSKDEKVFVVLRLGSAFAGTKVTVQVFKKGQKSPLAVAHHIWGQRDQCVGLPFTVKDLTAQGGFGDYEAKYFIEGEEIRRTEFKIRPER